MIALETNDPMDGPSSSMFLSVEQTMVNIEKPHHHDVLCGRGVTTNRHPGNESFRSLVSLNKELYVSSTKRQKMSISRSIVEAVRSLNPPGRFLEKDPNTGFWSDICHKKAVEKTSQALRDGASNLRKQLSTDLGDPDFLNAVFDIMDVDNNDQKSKIKDSAKGEGIDPVTGSQIGNVDNLERGEEPSLQSECMEEVGFDEEDSNMEKYSNGKDKEKIRVSDKAIGAKTKPPPVKKGHRRVKSSPACAGTALNVKQMRKQRPIILEPPPSPGTLPERIDLAPRRSPNLDSPRQYSASQPSSPMSWGGGRPPHFSEAQSPGSHRSTYYDHHSPTPHFRPYGGPYGPPPPSPHMTFSRSPSSFDGPYHHAPPAGPPLPDHRHIPMGPPHRRPHYRPQGYYHPPGCYPPPSQHSPYPPPQHPPSPQGTLPAGRHQFSPSGYRSRPPLSEWSPRGIHHHPSPRHHHSPLAEYHPPRGEYHAGHHSPSWSQHSPSSRGQEYVTQGNSSSASGDNESALSVPNLGGENMSSKTPLLSPRMPLIPRSFQHRGESTPPRHPPAVPSDFTPPPSSSPRFVRNIDEVHHHRSLYSPASKDKESGKDDEKKEADFAPYPSLTESRASSSSRSTPLITMKDLGIRQRTKIEDYNHTSNGMLFSREDNSDNKDAELLPYYDQAEENPADEVDNDGITMSPIPFDREGREDPITLMELPENLLSLPISPCGPHDDPTSQ